METNELVRHIKMQMEFLEEAEQTGDESKVLYHLGVMRGMLDLSHADRIAADQELEEKLNPDDR